MVDDEGLLYIFSSIYRYTKEALEVSAKLAEMNPEYYTIWNYRKLAVEHLLKDQSDSEYIKSILDEELLVVSLTASSSQVKYSY